MGAAHGLQQKERKEVCFPDPAFARAHPLVAATVLTREVHDTSLAKKARLDHSGFAVLQKSHLCFWENLVDLVGFEPTTSSMPWKRAPNCATGPLHDGKTPVKGWLNSFILP